jgi:nucleoside permease NupC
MNTIIVVVVLAVLITVTVAYAIKESKMKTKTVVVVTPAVLRIVLLQEQDAALQAWLQAAEEFAEVVMPANAKGYEYLCGAVGASDALRRGRLPGFIEKKTVYRMHLIGAKVDKVNWSK